ncbi:MAG TPA: ribbon-helix-helix domain-containing protein [Candidatus Mcinerneyibacterium sp.]|nr:ribbon-helix-helix domain-containing protein [Candidatus Mcinerneyibacterium sp.]
MHRLQTVAVSSYLIEELDRLIKKDNIFKNRTEALNDILDEYLKRYKMAKVMEMDKDLIDEIGG